MKRATATEEQELVVLRALEKEQQEALTDSIYLRPSDQQAREFEERRNQITEMSARLRHRPHAA